MVVPHKGAHRDVVFISAKEIGHSNQTEQVILVVDTLDRVSSDKVIKGSNGKTQLGMVKLTK